MAGRGEYLFDWSGFGDATGIHDDDIVARQLREAAMREPDPEIREALWDEYRKYKGLEIPNE